MDPLTASGADVAAVEPVLRRVVGTRVRNKADVDDLVQDGLLRLLAVRGRLAADAAVPYAVATARNLAVSHSRRSTRATSPRRKADTNQPVGPEDKVLGDEARRAMRVALARLSESERNELVAHEVQEMSIADLTVPGALAASVRVRLARSRAKLRVEYVLALRSVTLPTSRCRPVLVALSGGDVARQRSVHAEQHMVTCSTCAALHDPLRHRRDI